MEPSASHHRILVCVTGLSPQVVTETLYALALRTESPFIPDEVHLITTSEGASRARLFLLDPDQGQFLKLCLDYDLDPKTIHFCEDSIHIIEDAEGHPLDDIRSPADNEAAADTITEWVRQFTSNPKSSVYASIAGGRKTLGFYLGYALSLYGRPQDRLSHVLVSTPFESHPEFFFPPRRPRVLISQPGNRPIRTDIAEITLAAIPFVRLRDGLPKALVTGRARFSAAVESAQRSLAPAELVIDAIHGQVYCAGVAVSLRPAELSFLAWFARRVCLGRQGVRRKALGVEECNEYLTEYCAGSEIPGGDYERVSTALIKGMGVDWFDQRRSRLNKALVDALGESAARPYRIESDGHRPQSCYTLRLAPGQIQFKMINNTEILENNNDD